MLAIVIIQVTHLAKRRGTQMKELRNAENDTFIASVFRGWHDYTYIYLLGSYHISYTYTCEYIIQIPIGIMILQAQFVHVSSCWPYEAECFHFVDVSCTSHVYPCRKKGLPFDPMYQSLTQLNPPPVQHSTLFWGPECKTS